MRVGVGFATLAALGMLSLTAARSDLVYSQPGDGTACSPSCWTSGEGIGQLFGYQTEDSFSLSQNEDITRVQWQGFYYDGATPSNNPVIPDAYLWIIDFYSNSSGLPGSLIYTDTAAVTSTLIGISTFDGNTVDVYNFTGTLPIAFDARDDTIYWFGMLSVQVNYNPFFLWSSSTTQTTNSYSAQTVIGGAPVPWYMVPHERAFSLFNVVPEPFTWAMMLTGFAGLGFLDYRRRQKLAGTRRV